MATTQERQAAQRDTTRTQARGRRLPSKQRAQSQMEGEERRRPGATGRGKYYHVEVRPKEKFDTFRTQDVGKKGGIQRVAGRRGGGVWADQKWLISKHMAHIENETLVPDNEDARQVLDRLGSRPHHLHGDRFEAKPRPDVPERAKPTVRQRRAHRQNIQKAQAARNRSQQMA